MNTEHVKRAHWRAKFWYFVHNAIAHPLLVFGADWGDRFHDWTAGKM